MLELHTQVVSHVYDYKRFTLPDLASTWKQIQARYDYIAAKNLQVK